MGIPIVEVTWQLYHYISIILYSIWNLYYLANQVIIKDIQFISKKASLYSNFP